MFIRNNRVIKKLVPPGCNADEEPKNWIIVIKQNSKAKSINNINFYNTLQNFTVSDTSVTKKMPNSPLLIVKFKKTPFHLLDKSRIYHPQARIQ